jgi:hypothetical protein
MAIELGLVEDLNGEVEGERRHHLGTGLRPELAQCIGDIGRAHPPERFAQIGRIAVQEVQQLGRGGRRHSRSVVDHHDLDVKCPR